MFGLNALQRVNGPHMWLLLREGNPQIQGLNVPFYSLGNKNKELSFLFHLVIISSYNKWNLGHENLKFWHHIILSRKCEWECLFNLAWLYWLSILEIGSTWFWAIWCLERSPISRLICSLECLGFGVHIKSSVSTLHLAMVGLQLQIDCCREIQLTY